MTRIHFLALVLGIAFIALSAVIRIADPPAARLAREILFDQYQRLKPREYQPRPIRILDIDEASLAGVGQWPWPRTYLARVVARLNELGAASVAFDMVMPEGGPHVAVEHRAAADVRAAIGAEVADALDSKLPDNDEMFAQAIADRNIVLGFGILPGENDVAPAPQGRPRLHRGSIRPGHRRLRRGDRQRCGARRQCGGPRRDQHFAAGQPGHRPAGAADLERRQAGLPKSRPGGAARGQGAETILVRSTPEEPAAALSVRVGEYEIPTTRRGEFRVYFTRETPERYVSIARLLQDPPDESLRPLIEGNIIFIGTSAVGLLDVRTTPLGDTVPGVSVHAQALEQVLTGTYLLRPDWVDPLEMLLIVVLGLTVALTVIFSGPVLALGLGGLIAFNASVGSWIAFRNYGLLFDPLFALGTALALHFALTSFRYLVTDRDKRFVRRAFGRYVSPAILAKIEQNPKALRLGGEVRDLTILFLDIRSFTSLSEKLSPTELIEFLNRILGQLSESSSSGPARSTNISATPSWRSGTRPWTCRIIPSLACRASLRLRTRLQELNDSDAFELKKKNHAMPIVRIGVGINEGSACVGNMGSEHRFNYSVVGDAVNISARIQGLTKEMGVDILAAESVREHAEGFAWLEAGEVELRGRENMTNMFVLVGDEEVAASEAFAALQAPSTTP